MAFYQGNRLVKVLLSNPKYISLVFVSINVLTDSFLRNNTGTAKISNIFFENISGIHKPLFRELGCIRYFLHVRNLP